MGDHHGVTSVAFCVLLACASAGCKRKETNEPPPPPTDRLAQGEAVEGKDKAYALPLPRFAKITSRGDKFILVTTGLAHEDLVNFVRSRVQNGEIVSGSGATQMRDVNVASEPARKLTIDIRPSNPLSGSRSEMTIRDTTPPPIEPGLSEEERWKKAGLTPQGKILDPKQLQ